MGHSLPAETKESVLKEMIRNKVWTRLTNAGVSRPPLPIHGRIPNFVGADYAAERLCQLPIVNNCQTVFCGPDSPQIPVRYRLLCEGKNVIMASPQLRTGFLILNPQEIPTNQLTYAATIRGAFKIGRQVKDLTEKIDAKIFGSVAVDSFGGRVGKGGGYSDLESAILAELGLVTPQTPIITTVHDLQIVTEKIVMNPHDTPVDVIVTPTRQIRTHTAYPRPQNIKWSYVSEKRRVEIAWPSKLSPPQDPS
ncbi:MAG: 5-formyltetrahydrofolate cyclo-ligase [Promethearchaeota archaeon]